MTALINDIIASSSKFVLVLDDYHLITTQPIHEALAFLLDHLPGNIHLVIITRADPPLSLARLRGRDQLTELRQTDLRFTPTEISEFLNQKLGLGLSVDEVAALTARTEGWIAGLQMATLTLQSLIATHEQDQERIASFVQAFAGSNRYILDYLVEEVLQRQPDNIQRFLLQTAILNQLTGSLCDAVTGQADSQSTLEMLERSNLFIVPLDDERRWYRYHHLFADLLRHRLYNSPPVIIPADKGGRGVVAELHRRASEWYKHHEFIAAAIEHTLLAGDFERAAALIEQAAETTLLRSEVVTFLGWVEQLPSELVRAYPNLHLFQAGALLASGWSIDVVEAHLQDIDHDSERLSGQVAVLRAVMALLQGQLPQAVGLYRQAVENLSADDLFWHSLSNWVLSVSYVMDYGNLADSSRPLTELARVSRESGSVMAAVAILSNLAALRLRQAKLHQAQAIFEQALELATGHQERLLPIAGEALMGLGELWREWNDFEIATRYLSEGIELTEQWRKASAYPGYISLARIKQAQGDGTGAHALIQQARQLIRHVNTFDGLNLYLAAYQARLWIMQGNLKAATRWAEERELVVSAITARNRDASASLSVNFTKGLGTDIDLATLEQNDDLITYHLHKYEQVVLARVLLAQNRPSEAQSLLEPLQLQMEQQGRLGMAIEVLMLKALARQAQDKIDQALTILQQALALAEPEGYVRLFVDEGLPMLKLLHQATARSISPEYVSHLLSAFPDPLTDVSIQNLQSKTQNLIDPLSERELEVLRLMAVGLKYKEIAGRLFISLNTVRHHTKNIYSKLNVHSRPRAITRAKELNLL